MSTLEYHLRWCNLIPARPLNNILLVGVANAKVVETYNRVYGEIHDDLFIKPRTNWVLVDPIGGAGVIAEKGEDFISNYRGPEFDLVILDGWQNKRLCPEFLTHSFSECLARATKTFTANMLTEQAHDLRCFRNWSRLHDAIVGTNTVVSFQRRG